MKINQSSFLLFLLPAISAALADTYNDNIDSRVSREIAGNNARLVDSDIVASNVAKGAPDVPVDGKDGRPHAGPWVETNADRDNKVVKGSDDVDQISTKYDTKIPSSEHLSTEDGKVIPHSNGGVMDDPYRASPKEGTRGTEGGVSEKGKENQLASEKVPGGPREAPPLPHSETKKVVFDSEDTTTESGSRSAEGPGSLGMLEKPAELPEKTYDIPPPKPPATVKGDPLGLGHDSVASGSTSSSPSSSLTQDHDHEHDTPDAMHSLIFSFTMIIVSEIGDKTFLVAALMAMRHPRLVVFSAAFSALIGMTVLSAVLGHAVPTLIPKTFTKFMAAILFLVFGVKMLKEGREMSPDEGVGEEMREVEAELEEKEHEQLRMGRRRSSVTPHNLEAGRAGGRPKTRGSGNRLPSPPESLSSSSSRGSSPQPRQRLNDVVSGLTNLFSLLLSPAWVQTFVMTFLGEWGDRSQIATIAMAAGQDYWWVTIGASAGHGICTAAAVIGGRAIAGRVSMRVVTLGGAVAFLVFGIIYFIEAIF
ncbi:uncharacterized protein N7479_000522 [Penicillium vulpinum]|uniref:GDT1 family protein n=1 Tax=Penicillium vulpinum TaxID=29845 RepID=A0A1V6S5B7_9EURO|nr:uncharacterized protein N7479_000522 [Penicillium vulpinum]KAJ5970604.1 hypothetical protein N7479_000522 [Penicillium vulpinum]OQE09251.1 hypothetical protein PENVUL_c007G05102 [Penicillium vulpinum]